MGAVFGPPFSISTFPILEPTMWNIELVAIVRALIDDMGDPPKYSDEKIESLILIAANQLLGDIPFPAEYQVNFSGRSISPDPTIAPNRDNEFCNFLTVKAACIYNQGAAMASARKALTLRDGGTTIDTSKQTDALMKLLEKGWCAVYEQMKYERAMGSSKTGLGIVGPIRSYCGY